MNSTQVRGYGADLDASTHHQHMFLPQGPLREPPDAPLIDVKYLRNFGRFMRNAVLRHRRMAAAVAVAFGIIGVLAAFVLPENFYAEGKLLADRNVVMPLLGNPSRRLPNEQDTPTRLAVETILNQQNLQKIVTSVNLISEADRTQTISGRVKQSIRRLLGRVPSQQERMNEVISLLRSRMNVYVGDGTVTIGANWNDADVSYRIVTAAQQNFIETRQAEEQALITGSIQILTDAASTVGGDILGTLDSLSRQRRALTPAEARPFASSTTVVRINPALTQARSNLEEASRALSDLQQGRARRLQDLQAKLSEQRNTYGPAHPEILNTEQVMRGLMVDPPQLAEMRRDVERYRAQVEQLGGNTIVTSNTDQALAAAAIRSIEGMRSDSLVQEKQTYGRSQLRIALASYQELLERLDAARMELKTVRATFKFKYGVLIPPTVPRTARSRKPKIVLGALLLGLVMGGFTAVALDLARARMLEAWQVERALGLPVLGEASLARIKA